MACTTPLRHIMLVATILDLLPPLFVPKTVGPPPVPLVKLMVVLPPASIVRFPLAKSLEKALPPTT